MLRSDDFGASWSALGQGDIGTGTGVWYNHDDTNTFPTHFSAVHQHGRAVILHNWAADPGNEDWSIGAMCWAATRPCRSPTSTFS